MNVRVWDGRLASLALSVVLHGMALAAGGMILSQPVRYGVQSGQGGLEIHLVAAPAEPIQAQAPVETLPAPTMPEPIVPIAEPEAMAPPFPEKTAEAHPLVKTSAAAQVKRLTAQLHSGARGDGSSAVAGSDSKTFYSSGGARVEAKPDYLQNPAPPYPWQARQKGWEGTVILIVEVDKTGYPVKIEMESGSGHEILDKTALETVRKWKFQPARLGGLPVESTARVPIRFELDRSS